MKRVTLNFGYYEHIKCILSIFSVHPLLMLALSLNICVLFMTQCWEQLVINNYFVLFALQ